MDKLHCPPSRRESSMKTKYHEITLIMIPVLTSYNLGTEGKMIQGGW